MARLDPVAELKADHEKVRDDLLALINSVSKRNAQKSLEILLRLDKMTGPHFRFEEESFYPALEKFYGRDYHQYLLGVHDRIIKRAKDLAAILGKGEITAKEAEALPGILRTEVLSHPIECEGIALFAAKLTKTELDKIAQKVEECRKAGVPLLEWGDNIKDKERAKRGIKAKTVTEVYAWNLVAEGGDKVVLIVNTASWERVYLGLSLASAVAVLGEEVYVFFSFGGLIRLKKGSTDKVAGETSGWLREQIKAAVQQGGISKISDLIKDLRRLGGKVYACTAAMAVHNLTRQDLIDDIDEVQGMVEFYVSKAKGASKLIYL